MPGRCGPCVWASAFWAAGGALGGGWGVECAEWFGRGWFFVGCLALKSSYLFPVFFSCRLFIYSFSVIG